MTNGKNNPTGLKSGEQVILEKSNNGIPREFEGTMLTIVGRPTSRTRTYTVQAINGQNYTLYLSGQGNYNDEVSYADRKSQAASLRKKIKATKKDLKDMEDKAFELEQFETDEDFVAWKLAKIFKAGQGKNPEKEMAALLKQMKESNLL